MSRLNIIALIVFAGLLIWVTLFQPGAVSRIQNGAMVVFEPFMKASSRLESGVETVGTESLSPVQLQSLVADLERERDRLKLEVIQLDEIIRENNQLRRALQYVEKAPLEVVAARVINRKPSNWYSTMVIDKGRSHGVQVDSPVIVPVGESAGLVGKVSEVIGANSALVLLLTDEMCQVSAKLQNSQEQGILSGQRGALRAMPNLRLRYLSKEAEAGTGRRVLSSGAGGLFPPDLLLGEVTSFEIGAIDAEAVVKPSVNFEELVDVFVVLPLIEEAGALEREAPEETDTEEPKPVEAPEEES
ncbi:MAG: rod shape-determining protein MreC [Verrucomicrobiota bacterium]